MLECEAREKVYSFTKNYIKEHGYSPSVRDIMIGIGAKSTSTVQLHIASLFKEGKFETDAPPGTPRAIRLPGYEYKKKE